METKDILNLVSKNEEKLNSYIPEVICVNPMTLIMSNVMCYRRMIARVNTYKMKVIRSTHSNNWLKMHGYPMRRKSF